jgi:hypothetical protein
MNKKMFRNFTVILISLTLFTGCMFNTKENINRLPDKKFFFTEFQFILPGQTKESAMAFFKKFPVKKIMFMLAEEYNIIIDISDYYDFIKSGDTALLQPDGSFRITKHTWSKPDKENNRIIFIFEQDYFNADILKFKMGVYSKNSTLKLFNTEISTQDYILINLKKHLDTGEKSLKDYEEKNYDNISPVPGIVDSKNGTDKIEVSDDPNII